MADSPQPEPPVRRKIRAATSTAGAMDDRVARVWRQIAARALKASVGMNARATGVAAQQVSADSLADQVQPGEMSALMENDSGDIGLLLVSPGLIGALIEMQTIGRVTERPPGARMPTVVDGALVGPSVDRILATAAVALAGAGLRDPVTDYRFAMLTEAGTPPTLALADLPHNCVTLQLSIEDGRKQGALRFLIPDTGAGQARKAVGQADWQHRIGAAVLASDVAVEARIGRLRLPVDRVLALRVGEVVPLAAEDLTRVRLVVGRGVLPTRARLGQSNGFRAVKIVGDPSGSGDPVQGLAERDGAGLG